MKEIPGVNLTAGIHPTRISGTLQTNSENIYDMNCDLKGER